MFFLAILGVCWLSPGQFLLFSSNCHFYFYNCSIPLPNEIDVVVRYYIDWSNQLCACSVYYLLLSTTAVFFIGMYLYMGEMSNDLRNKLKGLNGNFDMIARGIIEEIRFHNDLLQYVLKNAFQIGFCLATDCLFEYF